MLNDGAIQKSDFRERIARSIPKVAVIANGRARIYEIPDFFVPAKRCNKRPNEISLFQDGEHRFQPVDSVLVMVSAVRLYRPKSS